MTQPAPDEQPTLTAYPAPVAFQAAQVSPRLSQPSGPTIEPGAFSPHFFTGLTFPNSNLLSRQVIELTSALAQQTTLVNQLLQHIGIQRAPDEVSRSRTRAYGHFQQRPGKQPRAERLEPRAERLGSVHSRLRARRSMHSRLGPRRSIHSRLGLYSDSQHEQPSGQSVYS
ncbi:hypothetical protein PS2_017529 [Malus domestica]